MTDKSVEFWLEVGYLLSRSRAPKDEDFAVFDSWYQRGEEFRLSGRSPAALVAEILATGGARRLQ